MEIISMPMDRTLEEVLDEGVQRLKQRPTWKLWTWTPETEEFYEAEVFRTFVVVRSGKMLSEITQIDSVVLQHPTYHWSILRTSTSVRT